MKLRKPRLTEEAARELARAAIAKLKEQQRTEVTELRELLADIVQKATPYGVQDGDFIASYILPTGPIHRAIKYLKEHGIAIVATPKANGEMAGWGDSMKILFDTIPHSGNDL